MCTPKSMNATVIYRLNELETCNQYQLTVTRIDYAKKTKCLKLTCEIYLWRIDANVKLLLKSTKQMHLIYL